MLAVYTLLANIRMSLRFMDEDMFKEIYTTRVGPKLEYGIFW